MSKNAEKFQALLRKLFQFDCAELDFGIYRILNQKRAVVEEFIENDLLEGVAKALGTGAVKDEADLRRQFDELADKIHEEFDDEDEGTSALDAEGNLAAQFHKTKSGKKYLGLQSRLRGARSAPELEAEIFNHLYTFFSRYYDEGDFMSLRRYSKRDKYAIPYNGEEVHLHWANSDQYYIKTGENFTDYSYRHAVKDGWTVRFKLRNADVEQNNVKGAKRFFIPRAADVALDPATRTLTVPFDYRSLTKDEEAQFPGNGLQEKILRESSPGIVAAAKSVPGALAALTQEKRRDADGNPVGLLDHHLRTYTRKNTSDFFIHKDLGGFLERELDFYLKNEVLNLDEIEAGGEPRAAGWFQMLRAIKAIGRKIIAFVAQIENFQKRLFEKKKFVTEVHYCVTLDRVPVALYPEIIKNTAQIEEWKRLFYIQEIEGDTTQPGFSEPLKPGFLEAHQRLVLDTKFFPADFTTRLLESKEFLAGAKFLDAAIGGLLVHAENFQALNLLASRYRQAIRLIYLDPPYNTGTDDFIYKDSYQHSSWLSLMHSRLVLASAFLSPSGILAVSLDNVESANLGKLLSGNADFTRHGEFVWRTRNTDNRVMTMLSVDHEYIHVFGKLGAPIVGRKIDRSDFKNPDADKRGVYTTDPLTGKANAEDRPNLHYSIINPETGDQYLPDPDFGWITDKAGFDRLLADKLIYWPANPATGKPRKKRFLSETSERSPISSLAISIKQGEGNSDLSDIMGSKLINFPKPVSVIRTVVDSCSESGDTILDFFGGSGTTAHAVIDTNRETAVARKYILVEAATHFGTIMKPRLQKVIYSKDWKDGKPVSRQGSSHAFKYLRLESFEDALDNIAFQPADGEAGQSLLGLENYVLGYMLDFETRESETLLNVAKLDAPFDYTLRRHGKDEPQPVDLPETFNYLIGLHIDSRRALECGTSPCRFEPAPPKNKPTVPPECAAIQGTRYLVYRGRVGGKATAIIWRTTKGWTEKEFEADRAFVAKEELTEGAEDIFVNTDSFIEGAQSLDPVFKNLMFNVG